MPFRPDLEHLTRYDTDAAGGGKPDETLASPDTLTSSLLFQNLIDRLGRVGRFQYLYSGGVEYQHNPYFFSCSPEQSKRLIELQKLLTDWFSNNYPKIEIKITLEHADNNQVVLNTVLWPSRTQFPLKR